MAHSVQEELWNIFTYYSLHGSTGDPFHLNKTQFTRFCTDSLLFDPKYTEVPYNRLKSQVLVSEISPRPSSVTHTHNLRNKFGLTERYNEIHQAPIVTGERLTFDEFLYAISKVGIYCYPSIDFGEDAFECILMENVLPFACRREVDLHISYVGQDLEVGSIFKYYEEPLLKIYAYYAADSPLIEGKKSGFYTYKNSPSRASQAARRSPKKKYTFGSHQNHNDMIGNNMQPSPNNAIIHGSNANTDIGRPLNNSFNTSHLMCPSTPKSKLDKMNKLVKRNLFSLISYNDFLRFMNDTGLGVAMNVTSYDIGHLYMSVMQMKDTTFSSRTLDFDEFCEVLVQCAIVGFRDKEVSTADKAHSIFMFIARQCDAIVEHLSKSKGSITNSENAAFTSQFFNGIQDLRRKFNEAWRDDDFRDYLGDAKKKEEVPDIDLVKHLTCLPDNERNDEDEEDEEDADDEDDVFYDGNNYNDNLIDDDNEISFNKWLQDMGAWNDNNNNDNNSNMGSPPPTSTSSIASPHNRLDTLDAVIEKDSEDDDHDMDDESFENTIMNNNRGSKCNNIQDSDKYAMDLKGRKKKYTIQGRINRAVPRTLRNVRKLLSLRPEIKPLPELKPYLY